MDGLMEGRTDGQEDRWMDGRMDGQMDSRMDGRKQDRDCSIKKTYFAKSIFNSNAVIKTYRATSNSPRV